MPNETFIDKKLAARRQLDCAIRLWMAGDDRLSVHTLTMAAFQILYDLSDFDADYPLTKFLTKTGQREFREYANFLKHADRDQNSRLREFGEEENEYRIGFSLVLFRALASHVTPEMYAFHTMMQCVHPEKFNTPPDPDPDIESGALMGAELARNDVTVRRLMAKGLLELVRANPERYSHNMSQRKHD